MNDTETTSEDDQSVPSPSVARKRGRTSTAPKSYAESDATTGDDEEDDFAPKPKKVKKEPVEEEDVTGAATNNSPLPEEDEGVSFI